MLHTEKRGRALSQKKGSQDYPDLAKWPPASMRQISQVTVAVLSKLVCCPVWNLHSFLHARTFHQLLISSQRGLDHHNILSRPVCEEHPAITEDYLRKVKSPMDFHTIEDERLHTYGHIAELQEDLILTFCNCCVFNGKKTEYYPYAL